MISSSVMTRLAPTALDIRRKREGRKERLAASREEPAPSTRPIGARVLARLHAAPGRAEVGRRQRMLRGPRRRQRDLAGAGARARHGTGVVRAPMLVEVFVE